MTRRKRRTYAKHAAVTAALIAFLLAMAKVVNDLADAPQRPVDRHRRCRSTSQENQR